MSETKRGINLGCGTTTLPCERPDHHLLIPDHLYTSTDIKWDNVDWNAGEGVDKVVDLFDYPWREAVDIERADDKFIVKHESIPSNTYDYAIAAHIVEHIPHHIVENGKFVHRHPLYQDGWFAWFSELWRVLKPGGTAWVLVPYAWSNSGISDPTHTRYLTPATFAYFNNAHVKRDFTYRMPLKFEFIDFSTGVAFRPHTQAVARVREQLRLVAQLEHIFSHGTFNSIMPELLDDFLESGTPAAKAYMAQTWEFAQSYLNMVPEFVVRLVAVKDDE